MDPVTPAPDANNQEQKTQPQGVPAAPITPPAPVVPPAPKAAPVQKPAAPQQNTTGASAHVDLKGILLPTKEIHSPASAQRVNAGALLDQEITAGEKGIPEEQKTKAPVPDKPPAPPAQNPSEVKALETYQGDIAEVIQNKKVSTVSIAAAESNRRSSGGSTMTTEEGMALGKKILLFLFGAVLIAGASGIVTYVTLLPKTVPVQTAAPVPFITADATIPVTLRPEDTTRAAIVQALQSAKDNAQLSLGLVARLYPVTPAATANTYPSPVSAQTLLGVLAPELPQEFLRSLQPEFLLGIYSYSDKQPFLILKTDSYEQAYAGMLQWEGLMRNDLSPLFAYTPRPRIPEERIAPLATTTNATSTTELPTSPLFVDRIVESRDARVVQDAQGDILLLWTFLDRNTLVITVSDATLREVITRLKDAPVIPLVGN